jgi:hypothetical protein
VIPLGAIRPPVPADEARREAQRELAKHIYHRYDEPWLVRVVHSVEHWLSHWLDVSIRHAPGGGVGAVVFVAILITVVLIARWRLGPVRREVREARPVFTDATRSAAEHRAAAERAATEQRWTEAVVERMRAVARELEERDVLDPRPGRTAEELATDAGRELPDVAEAMRTAAGAFDEVAYGGRPATPARYQQVVAADDAVRHRRRAPVTR